MLTLLGKFTKVAHFAYMVWPWNTNLGGRW
jgi:hypothetical protein